MNARKTGSFCVLATALAIPAYACAEDSHRCAQQFDDAQRLACYDAQYGKPMIVRPSSGAAAAPATVAAPVVAAPVVAAPAVAASKPRAAKVAVPAGNFTASISKLDLLRDGRFRATFDSGEVWTQLEPDKAVVLAVGDKVTVKKAMLGSFLLVTPAGIITRVKQVD
jgi:hypothetical protein